MGNFITNRIDLNREDRPLLQEDRQRILSDMCNLTFLEALGRFDAAKDPEYGTWLPITFDKVVPRPGAPEPGEVKGVWGELALAVASTGQLDPFKTLSENDPYEHLMPAEKSNTRLAHLERAGLAGLEGEDLVAAAETKFPGILAAGREVLAFFQETGCLTVAQWQERAWGTRAIDEDGRFMKNEEGGISIIFDSVNKAPFTFLIALAARYPDFQIAAAAYDEADNYAFFATSDDPAGTLSFSEDWDEDEMRRAKEMVHGEIDEGWEDDPECD